MNEPLIEARHLKKYFKVNSKMLHAVDDISFVIENGKTLGVVGESGCGKSTLGRTLLQLEKATSGEIFFDGQDILKLSKSEFKKIQRNLQMIFQDPYSSLNPRMNVAALIAEPMIVAGDYSGKNEIKERVKELMDLVGLASDYADSYPHELDGGRRQRIGVARALALNPKFIVCDEPVSALDVSIQAQILNLLMDLQDKLGVTYMFITHDLSVVRHISDDIMVMYLGQCVEKAPASKLFEKPLHPYTKGLLASIPIPSLEFRNKPKELLHGEITSPVDPPPGCRFAVRCPYATESCRNQDFSLIEVEKNHFVSCTLYNQNDEKVQSTKQVL